MSFVRSVLLYVLCIYLSTTAMDNNSITFKSIISVSDEFTHVLFNNEAAPIPIWFGRYQLNEGHPFGKVTAYNIQNSSIKELGKIAKLTPGTLQTLQKNKMLFLSYVLSKATQPTYALLISTDKTTDVNIIRTYILQKNSITPTAPLYNDHCCPTFNIMCRSNPCCQQNTTPAGTQEKTTLPHFEKWIHGEEQ